MGSHIARRVAVHQPGALTLHGQAGSRALMSEPLSPELPSVPPAGEAAAVDQPVSPATFEPAASASLEGGIVEAAQVARWRFWPTTRVARALLVAWGVLCTAYVVTAVAIRYHGMFEPYAIDGDQPQAVWHYWRYHVEGAFPPGHLLTDYAFVMHAPPMWWLLMATMSHVVTPIFAAKVLNLIAVVAACVALWLGVSKRSNAFIGFAAMALLVRSLDFTGIIAGGYARSFGPALTLAFLGAFMAGKHRLVLAILVLQAALYPSVVIPCGLAYGLYTVLAGPMRDRLRRMAGMFIAGLLIIGFGKFQDLAAPKWWGPLVTLEEALKMPSWQGGGRISEAPLKPIAVEVPRNLTRAFRTGGHVALPGAARAITGVGPALVPGFILALMAASGVWWLLRRRHGQRLDDAAPWQVPLTFAAAFVAYLLARELAFKLYLPYRPLQHVWPYMLYAGLPLAVWSIATNMFRRRQAVAIVVTIALSLGLPVLLFGDGLERGPGTYSNHGRFAKTYKFVQTLPIDAQLAGEFGFVDQTPIFTWHQSYVTRNLAHPFRAGFYNETERRIVAMYKALYATKLEDVVVFADKEKVDYFIYRTSIFKALDKGLFNPPRKILAPIFKNAAKTGFALAAPPNSAVVFREGPILIVSVAKLKEAIASGDITPPTPMTIDVPKPARRALPLDQLKAKPVQPRSTP